MVKAEFPKAGHEKHKSPNREYMDVQLEQMIDVAPSSIEEAIKKIKEAAVINIQTILAHFPLTTKKYSKQPFG